VYYQNLRGIHWYQGKDFFDLHVKKFEELYTDAQIKIDLIAESSYCWRNTAFKDYLNKNQLIVGKNISNDEKAIHNCYMSLSFVKIRKNHFSAISYYDEGTNSMMGDFISEQEKIIWMMQAWLEESL
jgi:starvation-inducible DNA-binding protein